MKLKEGFLTHEMDGEQIMVASDTSVFAGMVRSNKTAAFLVDCLKEDTTKEQIVDKMLQVYDASREQITGDVERILAILRKIGALDE